jgi:Crinkler effector protein N-terminal domain
MNATPDARRLWCIIGGDSQPFMVTAHDNDYIIELKQLIKKEREDILCDVNHNLLKLWKVGSFYRPAQTFKSHLLLAAKSIGSHHTRKNSS